MKYDRSWSSSSLSCASVLIDKIIFRLRPKARAGVQQTCILLKKVADTMIWKGFFLAALHEAFMTSERWAWVHWQWGMLPFSVPVPRTDTSTEMAISTETQSKALRDCQTKSFEHAENSRASDLVCIKSSGLKHSCSINLSCSGTDLISLLLGKSASSLIFCSMYQGLSFCCW